MATAGARPDLPVLTVRYHFEDGTYWAEDGSGWFGAADALSVLRDKAVEGIELHHEHPYRSRFYFETTNHRVPGITIDPVAYEEFWPRG